MQDDPPVKKEEENMLEFYKTFDNVTKRIDPPEPGCWINAVSPDEK